MRPLLRNVACLFLLAGTLALLTGAVDSRNAPPKARPNPIPKSAPAVPEPRIEVYFSPDGGCTDAVVREVGKARKTVRMQAYSFTSAPIAKALVEAHRRGVKVEVLLDKSQRREKYTVADFLTHAGIPTYIDAKHAIAHDKVVVVDGKTVLTGSFNFTKSAEESNAENLLVLRDEVLAGKYVGNWVHHRAHCVRYVGK
jgi:phosphatidylserine/phosphatidylglycerophosphate/cardiolipin synthase-like enzyme